jgi:hypothetical protein
MSMTLLSLVATDSGLLFNPESVVLADSSGEFGVRRTDTGDVVVPSGTVMNNPQQGLWAYEFEDPADGISYECAITIESGDETVRLIFYRYVPVAAEEAVGESESGSGSESDSESTPVRGIDLSFSALSREPVEGRGDMFRMLITASNPVLMPSDVFTYLKGPVDPRGEREPYEYFKFVATPFDVSIYPAGSPDTIQSPGFFRTDSLEILAQSTKLAEDFKELIESEVSCLVKAYNRLDVLEPRGEVLIDGSGEQSVVVNVEDPVCEAYSFDTGEQLELIQREIADL